MSHVALRDRKLPNYTRGEEIFNMVSHIVGGALGITATVLCVVMAAIHHNVWGVVGSSIYGGTMIVLYTMSSIYHGLSPRLTAKQVFRIIDHCSVFLLIAGTYTPIALCNLREYNTALGWTIFGWIWGMAALGITLNAINLERFKVFSMICYLGMGWCILAAIKPTVEAIPLGGLIFLFLGGIAYTIGAAIYAIGKKMKRHYVHSIFHLFVVLGSLLQFFCILFYVV
ncbi:MAG: hemolysin III family protein [Clostridia bacterium]|nr:hemolysin III family protein [Clostridia bacterium]